MDYKSSIVAVHQPNFLPWLGYFAKIIAADTFVFLDTSQFSKGSYQNRVLIKTPSGPIWLTAKVEKKESSFVQSRVIQLSDFDRWKIKHLKTLQANYARSKNFSYFYEMLSEFYLKANYTYLCDFNIGLISLVCKALNISTKNFVKASSMGIAKTHDDALIEICKKMKADVYLSGEGGRGYQDEAKFNKHGIRITYDFFMHPTYTQLWAGFEKGLSVVDLLFHEGENSINILKESVAIND